MRLQHALAFLTPVAVFVACSSGGGGTPTFGGPPGGFGQSGPTGNALVPGGTNPTGNPTSTNPGSDSGPEGTKDSGTTGPKDTGTTVVDTGTAASFDNYAACSNWVDTVNSLPCVTTPYDPATMGCTHTKSSCDLTSFYDCLSSAYTCTDSGGTSVLDASAASSCKASCGGA